jgi:hypothetical protein|tara:strand:+ start:1930 stop:2331 length:402 start_codon:yes stop_codon:yes gene_type:complete
MSDSPSYGDIYERYPDLFSKNCIDCETGWYDIIEQMCSAIQIYIDTDLSDDNLEFEFEYIREKFGVLDIEVYGGDHITDIVIDSCTQLGYSTCEYCGEQPAELYCSSKYKQWSYYKTLCLDHAIELYFYRLYK